MSCAYNPALANREAAEKLAVAIARVLTLLAGRQFVIERYPGCISVYRGPRVNLPSRHRLRADHWHVIIEAVRHRLTCAQWAALLCADRPDEYGSRPASAATDALPGTKAKVAVMRARVSRGEETAHPQDPTFDENAYFRLGMLVCGGGERVRPIGVAVETIEGYEPVEGQEGVPTMNRGIAVRYEEDTCYRRATAAWRGQDVIAVPKWSGKYQRVPSLPHVEETE